MQKRYREWITDARLKDQKEDADRLIHEQMSELKLIDGHVAFIATQHLREQAQRYLLPFPEFDLENGAWVPNEEGRWHLSIEEIAKVRSAVRREQKERWEHWQMRLTLLIGLMGTIIGLVSLLKK